MEVRKKYKQVIGAFVDKYEIIMNGCEYDAKKIWDYINNVLQVLVKLRKECNAIGVVDGAQRIVIYHAIVADVMKRCIDGSDKLSNNDKDMVTSAVDATLNSVLPEIEEMFNSLLTDMDTNNDMYVSKDEFTSYVNGYMCCCTLSICNTVRTGIAGLCGCLVYPILSCCNPKGIRRR